MTQAVLFDLDGTLADTALDLGGALNTLLRRRGLPEKSMAEIRPVASHGAAGLLQLGAGIEKSHPEFAQWRQDYLAEYERCFDCDTVLFAGINELIAALDARGIVWGNIANKPVTDNHVTVTAEDAIPFDEPDIIERVALTQQFGAVAHQIVALDLLLPHVEQCHSG